MVLLLDNLLQHEEEGMLELLCHENLVLQKLDHVLPLHRCKVVELTDQSSVLVFDEMHGSDPLFFVLFAYH